MSDSVAQLTAELARVGNMREYYKLAERQLTKDTEPNTPAHNVGVSAGSQGTLMDEAIEAGKQALNGDNEEARVAAIEALRQFQ